jgi:hypothetical protein
MGAEWTTDIAAVGENGHHCFHLESFFFDLYPHDYFIG